MKTPDEIKKGLKICYMGLGCEKCPYDTAPAPVCYDDMKRDAIAYIQQLEKRFADVNASPFDGSMSQAEYFSGGAKDAG